MRRKNKTVSKNKERYYMMLSMCIIIGLGIILSIVTGRVQVDILTIAILLEIILILLTLYFHHNTIDHNEVE